MDGKLISYADDTVLNMGTSKQSGKKHIITITLQFDNNLLTHNIKTKILCRILFSEDI